MAKQEQSCPAFRTSIGGQALIEGILMRGPEKQAVVVRSGDEIVSKVEELHPLRERHKWAGWPLIRGVVGFIDSLVNGMKALTYSASFLPEEEQDEPTKLDLWVEKKFGTEKAEKFVIGVAMVLGVALAVALFVFLPTLNEIRDYVKDQLVNEVWQEEQRFENPDGTEIIFNRDYFGDHREIEALPGPFACENQLSRSLW